MYLSGGLAISPDENAHILLGQQELAAGQRHYHRRPRLAAGEQLCERPRIHMHHVVPAQPRPSLSCSSMRSIIALPVSNVTDGLGVYQGGQCHNIRPAISWRIWQALGSGI